MKVNWKVGDTSWYIRLYELDNADHSGGSKVDPPLRWFGSFYLSRSQRGLTLCIYHISLVYWVLLHSQVEWHRKERLNKNKRMV